MNYDVTAIIPVLGPQPLLRRAVESALANPEVRELIVVDDGSSVSLELALHPKMKVIRHDTNRGPAAARNTGARTASCDWIAFLDADDVWQARKTRMQLDALRNDGTGALGAVCAFTFERGDKCVIRRPPEARLEFRHSLAGARFGLGSTLMISRAAFVETGGYNESYTRYEDWEWLLRILKNGHFITLQDELVDVTHGYRAEPTISLSALSQLARSAWLADLPPDELRIFKAAIALEKASLLLSDRKPLASSWSILAAARHRPVWTVRAVFNRLAGGAIPDV